MINNHQLQRKGVSGSVGNVLAYAIMGTFALITVFPIIWLFISSVKTNAEFQMNIMGLPQEPTLQNFQLAWRKGEFNYLIVNSVFFTLATTLGIVVLSFMAGFALAKIPSRATKFIHNAFLIGILLTIQSIMIPLFLMLNIMNLTNTYPGILIPYIGIGLPMGIYLGTEFIKSIPSALVESARIDGADYLKIFVAIILPMTIPVAITLSIMTISATWNEFILISVLASDKFHMTLPYGIYRFSGSLASDWGVQFAALVVGMLPMLIFYLLFQKKITEGVAAGAVKG